MNFEQELQVWRDFDFEAFFSAVQPADVERTLRKNRLTAKDFLILLSPLAEGYLEELAQRSHALTVQHFGRTQLLYTPLYLANYCVNGCIYCGFQLPNQLERKKLTPLEVEAEAKIIAATGLKHILILTGESRRDSPVEYIKECVLVLKRYFASISIEVYPLSEDEYRELVAAGVDGLTIYQEVYNPEIYSEVHLFGPKRNYSYRLEAPERACRAGMRSVGIGALLGLNDWRREAFCTGLHARYLEDRYPSVDVSISMPRIRPQLGGFQPKVTVSDKNLVQYITAYRLFMPRSGITISTRESAFLRDRLLLLGVTKMSAGSCTAVGGRSDPATVGQFEISDERSVAEMAEMLYQQGYQPVYKDWEML